MKKQIIAVGHQKYVGKDTFVGFCVDILKSETRGLKIVQRGFATKLYEFLHSTYSWAGFRTKSFYDVYPEAKDLVLMNGRTAREMLIESGNKLRECDPDIWLNSCLLNTDFDILFITDLRYPNEFEAVKLLGGILIRITRPNLPVPTDIADTALTGYAASAWTVNLNNAEGKNSLYALAEVFVKEYILK